MQNAMQSGNRYRGWYVRKGFCDSDSRKTIHLTHLGIRSTTAVKYTFCPSNVGCRQQNTFHIIAEHSFNDSILGHHHIRLTRHPLLTTPLARHTTPPPLHLRRPLPLPQNNILVRRRTARIDCAPQILLAAQVAFLLFAIDVWIRSAVLNRIPLGAFLCKTSSSLNFQFGVAHCVSFLLETLRFFLLLDFLRDRKAGDDEDGGHDGVMLDIKCFA
jgi:hypothetical protein